MRNYTYTYTYNYQIYHILPNIIWSVQCEEYIIIMPCFVYFLASTISVCSPTVLGGKQPQFSFRYAKILFCILGHRGTITMIRLDHLFNKSNLKLVAYYIIKYSLVYNVATVILSSYPSTNASVINLSLFQWR